jgi:NADPH2 dehydrogenase
MKIFEPFKIKDLELKNRVIMAPMCMYSSDEHGFVKPFHIQHYASRAIGGVGLIIIEATAVEPRGRISGNDLGIWSDEHIAGLKTIVDAVHDAGGKIGIQLAHAGRKCMVKTEELIDPSGIAYSDAYATPKKMTITEIETVIQAFKEGAIRAKAAGFDLIEIHGAHGYLINQFLSPLTNVRSDEFGGSQVKRWNFMLKIIHEVKSIWDKPLGIRLSTEEYAEGGNHIEDTIAMLREIGSTVDIINVSSGGVVSVKINSFPGYQIPLSQKIKEAGFLTIGGGIITTAEQIEEILSNHQADFVFLARELLRNPYFMLHVAKKYNRLDLIPKVYERGF